MLDLFGGGGSEGGGGAAQEGGGGGLPAGKGKKRARGEVSGSGGTGGGAGVGGKAGHAKPGAAVAEEEPLHKRSAHRGAGGAQCPVPADATAIFVSGLPFKWTDGALLASVFTSALPGCEVAEARVALDGEGKGRGFGYVRFATEAMATEAMGAQAGGRQWKAGGRELQLQVCKQELVDKFHQLPKPPKQLPPIFGTSKAFKPRAVGGTGKAVVGAASGAGTAGGGGSGSGMQTEDPGGAGAQ